MRPRDLLEVAEHLVDAPSKRPKEAFLRRAVSSAYYAMFSCLCTCCADQLVGKTYKKAHPDIWAVAYRAINHGVTAEKLKSGKLGNVTSSQGVALFADELLDMREERMSADYDPNWRANKAGVRTSIGKARTAIDAFEKIPPDELKKLAIYLTLHHKNRAWPAPDDA